MFAAQWFLAELERCDKVELRVHCKITAELGEIAESQVALRVPRALRLILKRALSRALEFCPIQRQRPRLETSLNQQIAVDENLRFDARLAMIHQFTGPRVVVPANGPNGFAWWLTADRQFAAGRPEGEIVAHAGQRYLAA